jgi:hypothetical protein
VDVKIGFSNKRHHKFKDFINKMLRKMLASKMDELTEGWIKLHIKVVSDLYPSFLLRFSD